MSRDRDTLLDIADLLEQLQRHAPSDENVFREDSLRQAATIQWLRRIARAAARLSPDVTAAHAKLAEHVQRIRAAADREYDQISLDAVWRALRGEVPALAACVREALDGPDWHSTARRRDSAATPGWDDEPRRRLTLEDLRARRAEILDIAERHGARAVSVFGSVARGDADAASDVDVLIDLEPGRSLLDLVALRLDLVDLLGVHVDVATVDGLRERIRDDVLGEAVGL